MELQKLNEDVIAKIRSSFIINNITQCTTELVLNSLDAKSSAIAIRLNFVLFKIQVVDNGEGISRKNMDLLGQRYMTNKCSDLKDLQKHSRYYGFHGEALASIAECSRCVIVSSKCINSSETYTKTLTQNSRDIKLEQNRPSVGTTVTVDGFFYNIPIRQKRIVAELEFQDIRRSVEGLIVMHPNVSFSVRNDVSGEVILNSPKQKDIISTFKFLHPEVISDFSLMKVSKNKVSIEALLFKKMYNNKHLQYTFVNKRLVCSNKLQKLMNDLFLKNEKKDVDSLKKWAAYVVNIKCPRSQVVITNATKTMVDFQNWKLIMSCLEKLMNNFFGTKCTSTEIKKMPDLDGIKITCGISQMQGACKSFGYKHKCSDDLELVDEKISKLQSKDIIYKSQFYNSEIYEQRHNANLFDAVVDSNENNELKICKRYLCDTNDISDTSPLQPMFKTMLKNPLPIELSKNKQTTYLKSKENENTKTLKKNDLSNQDTKESRFKKQEDVECNLSRFTRDENKGKSLILDMFLKSTQVYSSDDISDAKSEDTIFEIESNYQVENNYRTLINGVSKTMSVSVNVKSTKKLKKSKLKIGRCSKNISKLSKCVQTTFDKALISKCLQTSIKTEKGQINCESTNINFNMPSDEYTIVVSGKPSNPQFKFSHQTTNNVPKEVLFSENKPSACFCSCHSDNEFFLHFFGNNTKNKNKNNVTLGSKCSDDHINQHLLKVSPVKVTTVKTKSKLNHINIMNSCVKRKNEFLDSNLRFLNTKNSPYFSNCQKKYVNDNIHNGYFTNLTHWNQHFKIGQLEPYEHFVPNKWSTQIERNEKYKIYPSILSNDNELFHDKNVSFENFRPLHFSTQKDLYHKDQTPSMLFRNTLCSNMFQISEASKKNDFKFTISEDLISKSSHDGNELLITLYENEKINILEKELETEKFITRQKDLNNEPEITNYSITKTDKMELEKDWTKMYNNAGDSYYFNKITGFTSYYTPKVSDNIFKLNERLNFVPKGMSPILKEIKPVDKSLSQNKKNKLLEYIMDTYKNELFYIKWQNYIQNTDPKIFFENMYKEKIQNYKIVNAAEKNCDYLNTMVKFDKNVFYQIKIIGQVDKKFIVAFKNDENMLLIFDQHAVHERIRLERLLKAYPQKTCKTKEKIMLFMLQNDLSILKKHKKYVNSLGLVLDFFLNGINITEVPECVYNKVKNIHYEKPLNEIVQVIIQDIIELLKSTRGIIIPKVPEIIQNILKMEACRGAIKFGDILTRFECHELLKQLATCDLPFQCAHGRPTLIPLITLNPNKHFVPMQINIKNLNK